MPLQTGTDPTPRDRLIVALDLPTVAEARDLVAELGDEVAFYKVGLELLLTGARGDSGLGLVADLVDKGCRVFVDAKLLDIGNTVERSVAQVAGLGAEFLTIHGHDTQTLRAALAGRGDTGLKLLAVTVLTSLGKEDLAEQGTTMAPRDLVMRRAKLASAAGFNGVIASGQEAAAVRAVTAQGFRIVTPGIRLDSDAAGDQKRITTPADAIASGADHIVVGRPINAARDPKAAARRFIQEIKAAVGD